MSSPDLDPGSPVPELSVAIPAYNEELRLGATLESILRYLSQQANAYEVLVCDDGSQDDTTAVARRYASQGVRLLELPRNRGKGAALRHAVLASQGRRVLLSDADLSTPIEELPRLEARLAEAPMILGSRAVASAQLLERQPIYRELMGKTFNQIVRRCGVPDIRDTQCGFKLIEGDLARHLFSQMITDGFAYDVELVWLAQRAGHRVLEEGVTWINSPSSRVRVLIDPMKMLLEISRFRWHHRKLPPA